MAQGADRGRELASGRANVHRAVPGVEWEEVPAGQPQTVCVEINRAPACDHLSGYDVLASVREQVGRGDADRGPVGEDNCSLAHAGGTACGAHDGRECERDRGVDAVREEG